MITSAPGSPQRSVQKAVLVVMGVFIVGCVALLMYTSSLDGPIEEVDQKSSFFLRSESVNNVVGIPDKERGKQSTEFPYAEERVGRPPQQINNEPLRSEENTLDQIQPGALGRFRERISKGKKFSPIRTPPEPESMATTSTKRASFTAPTARDWLNSGQRERAEAVKGAMEHAWKNYKKYAWGMDELEPMRKAGKNWLGLGATIVDSLDTLYIMEMKDEYQTARNWIANELSFNKRSRVSTFETTIRSLGGMLSAYALTGDNMYVEKSKDLGLRLLRAFGDNKMPKGTVELKTGRGAGSSWAGGRSVLSEVGTMQMEFFYLGLITEDPSLSSQVLKVFDYLDEQEKPNGLYSIFVNAKTGLLGSGRVTLGALGDSFYEYLMKMWLLTNKQAPKYKRMYNEAMRAVDEHMLKRDGEGHLYLAELSSNIRPKSKINKMDHLVCFAGGMYALGSFQGIEDTSKERDDHMLYGKEITSTCYEGYTRMPTGIAPEILSFNPNLQAKTGAKHYLLRPETVESLFVLWRVTGDEKYREWGWNIFQSIERHCRHENGYVGLRDVTRVGSDKDPVQQSFFLAETLKYLYLLFAPNTVIPLDRWVFNTEAHPLPIITEPLETWRRFHPAKFN